MYLETGSRRQGKDDNNFEILFVIVWKGEYARIGRKQPPEE